MKTKLQSAILGTTLACTTLAGGVAQALDLSGNVGLASNYMWRGVTQTDDQAAISGGLDLGTDLGIYVGTWMSNVDFGGDKGYELDLYGGYAHEWGNFGLDVGAIYYAYPTLDSKDNQLDFSEGYVGASYAINDNVSVGGQVAYTWWARAENGDKNLYYAGNVDFVIPVLTGIDSSVYVGRYEFDDSSFAKSYVHWGASIGKSTDYGDFALAYDQTDNDEGTNATTDNPRFTASWTLAVDF